MKDKEKVEIENEEVKEGTNKNDKTEWLPIGMCMGTGLGMCGGGFVFDNMYIGLVVGMILGMLIGSGIDAASGKKSENETKTGEDKEQQK